MNQLAQAMQTDSNKAITQNGMEAMKSSMHPIVDLFFAIGASRGNDISELFDKALKCNSDMAVRTALYARDVRGGMGERQLFRDILKQLATSENWYIASNLIHMVPVVGRWDDLFAFVNTPVEYEALRFYADALRANDALAAKWAPREKSTKSHIAYKLRRQLGMSSRQYRKLIVRNTNVVETPMSAKDYSDIDYSKLPSLASIRYQKAFSRNDSIRYEKYIKALEKGEAKINAGAVYPHDIVKSIKTGEHRVAEQQWKALPDYIPEGNSFFPMVDVSYSMNKRVGNNPTLSCMDVSIALGMYTSMRNKSDFKNKFLTFDSVPEIVDIDGLSLKQAYNKTERAKWGGTTDVIAGFERILDIATSNQVSQEDMPDYMIVFSDMQFNRANRGENMVYGNVKEKFKQAGYELPGLVFWNLKDYSSNVPVKFDNQGVALVSGFSPSIMTSILSMKPEELNPENVVINAIFDSRYDWVK